MPSDLLLLSGGIDSACVAAWKPPDGALVIDYGQGPARGEIMAAQAIGVALGIPVDVLTVDCSVLGSGLLAGTSPLPDAPSPEWWPYRNQLLVTLAATWALPRGYEGLVLGIVASDAERHADARKEFLDGLDSLLTMQEAGMRLDAPARGLTSSELIEQSGAANAVLSFTHSCHVGELACGRCPGCEKHVAVLRQAGRLTVDGVVS